VLLITAANIYLWFGIIRGGPAPRARRFLGLIIMLAVGAMFSEKFTRKQFGPKFIQVGCLIGMTAVFFILYKK